MLNGLDLFSGIGGISLALRKWVRPVAYCEIDPYAQSVLVSRMSSGQLSGAPIWDDVTSLCGSMLPGIDIISGGFPCQDISCAGPGGGLGGGRSGLFQHVARLAGETNPRFIFLENVPAIRTRGLNSVVQTLTDMGYDCRWTVVSAEDLGAPHLRKRWFLLAKNRNAPPLHGEAIERRESNRDNERLEKVAAAPADAQGERSDEGAWWFEESETKPENAFSGHWWSIEPDVDRVVYGVPKRVDKPRTMGLANPPAQFREAFMRLMGLDLRRKASNGSL